MLRSIAFDSLEKAVLHNMSYKISTQHKLIDTIFYHKVHKEHTKFIKA
jgi:hypothetical protein